MSADQEATDQVEKGRVVTERISLRKLLAIGLLSGVVAAILMTLVLLLLRHLFGVATPSELAIELHRSLASIDFLSC